MMLLKHALQIFLSPYFSGIELKVDVMPIPEVAQRAIVLWLKT
jgi:hypothetical protein